METVTLLNALNPAQQAAVSAPLGHQLILAGAGSGKTRVLTHRIAWLMEVEHIPAFNLLAVTFTNKAAAEMRARVENMRHHSTKSLWIGTFHSLSHRLLRTHWEAAHLPQSFQILDADDQLRLIRRVIQALNLDENRFPPKEAQGFINAQKEEGRAPSQVKVHDFTTQTLLKIYQAYQEACQRAGVIDFTDLLLKTCQLLQTNADISKHYQSRFRCLLVDEFQDTNTLQYTWLKLLAGQDNAIMVVGDDDQSIYGWRGARIENIQRFANDFPTASVYRLEQNYRSTGTILKAANALIAKNDGRLGKNLWTAGQMGEPITIYAGFNEADEAFFIVNRIREWQRQSLALSDMAILYRSNAQSRVLEEALIQFGLPYRVYGGLRYFDRAEIKDALAYLRLIANPHDDPALERVINMPPRGIGDRTLMAIREEARLSSITLWEALTKLLHQHHFSTRTENALLTFVNLIESLTEKSQTAALSTQIESVIQMSGLINHYRQEKGEKGLTRVENLEELINAAQQFTEEGIPDDMPPLAAFLAYAALESGNEEVNGNDQGVQLMTLHAAKGLEFKVVFLAGCEEELFPHYLSLQSPKALEEERRLCYVGITRAMQKLYMTYAEVRRLYGKEAYHRPSRFLQDIPEDLVDAIRFRTRLSRNTEDKDQNLSSVSDPHNPQLFRIGQRVRHRVFGEGTVLSLEGEGDDMKVKVNFAQFGVKTLIASYLTA